MLKIKTKADANTLAAKFVAEDPNFPTRFCPGFNAEKPSLCIIEEVYPHDDYEYREDKAIIMTFARTDKDHWDSYRPHMVYFYNDCTGGEWSEWMSLKEIADQFWQNRKYINKYQAHELANL